MTSSMWPVARGSLSGGASPSARKSSAVDSADWDGNVALARDLGAALGETGKLFPRRNWIEGFEREPFIESIEGTMIEFGYGGRHAELLSMIGPDDVRWAASQMQRLTDAQWRDAFRAANYAAPPNSEIRSACSSVMRTNAAASCGSN